MHLRIKYLRKTLKLSQADFGTRIEVSRITLNKTETNVPLPNILSPVFVELSM